MFYRYSAPSGIGSLYLLQQVLPQNLYKYNTDHLQTEKASSPNVDFCCRECTAAPAAESTRLSIGDATLPYADATVDPYSESTVVHREQSFPSTPDLPNHDTSSVDLTRQTFSIAPESIEA